MSVEHGTGQDGLEMAGVKRPGMARPGMESPRLERPDRQRADPEGAGMDRDARMRALVENNRLARHDLVSKIRALGQFGGLEMDQTLEQGADAPTLHKAGVFARTVEKLASSCGLVLKKDQLNAFEELCDRAASGDGPGTDGLDTDGLGTDGLGTDGRDMEQALFERWAHRAGWRMRPVEVDRDIHRRSAPVLLAFRADTGAPLVLYPNSNGGRLYDPVEDCTRPLTAEDSAGLADRGYCFYESFPEGGFDNKKLLAFIFRHSMPTLTLVCVVGLVAALLSLVVPVVTQHVTGKIIPTADYQALKELGFLLLVLTACQTGFQLVPSLSMLYFGTRQYERFQAAVFDHALRVPVTTYQMCSAGDMTQRLLGAATVQNTVFTVLTGQFLGAIFHLASLVMMFWYSTRLALLGMCLVLVYAGGLYALARVNLGPLREHAMATGRLTGLLRQFIEGMGKIRSAVAETRVINRCMDDFSVQVRTQYHISRNGAVQSLFSTGFPMLVSLLFYALVGGHWRGELDLPSFMAFMAAFQGFQTGIVGVAGGWWTLQSIRPEIERIRPLLETLPENAEGGEDPGVLDGRVEFSHVSFRYENSRHENSRHENSRPENGRPEKDLPLVLDDVSLTIEPGSFVAIVGSSGAGKSTLARLLLGFERPETGAVFVSGRDLGNLDVRAVRRQFGVILQSSRVIPGSILENINIGTHCTLDDAWLALERAAMAETVRQLPMGIHTMVSPETISGGQQQRILIARALVGRPALVLMDESTSALDNETQKIVQSHLEQLRTTRVVIAHRLSTIVNADRIYVLDKGRVVQSGTYRELMSEEGVFLHLARRQLTGEALAASVAQDAPAAQNASVALVAQDAQNAQDAKSPDGTDSAQRTDGEWKGQP